MYSRHPLFLVLLRQWDHVISYVKKGESDKNKDGTDDLSRSKFQCAHALADLVNHNYNNAAQKFLSLKFESFDYRYFMTDRSLGGTKVQCKCKREFSEVISSSNVATYGGLCSLASLDRKQLKEKVLQSPNFKQFLELEPCMREVIVGKGHCRVTSWPSKFFFGSETLSSIRKMFIFICFQDIKTYNVFQPTTNSVFWTPFNF